VNRPGHMYQPELGQTMSDALLDDSERCLAAFVRQYMRATGAADADATRLTLYRVWACLTRLLTDRLEEAPDWDSETRWVDGLHTCAVVVEPPWRLRITGPMAWGLTADVGGPQWLEPFDADLRLSRATGQIESYELRFGDRDQPNGEDCRQEGSERIVARLKAGRVAWAFTFAKSGGE
jgi:hypothetical protein